MTDLILAGVTAELDADVLVAGSRTAVRLENLVRVAIAHRDRVRVEVEARPVTRFADGRVVTKIGRGVVVDDDLQAALSDDKGAGLDANVCAVAVRDVTGNNAIFIERIDGILPNN